MNDDLDTPITRREFKLFRRWAATGYVILALGFVVAWHGNGTALQDSKDRGASVRAVLCEGIKEEEEDSVKNLNNKVVKELHLEKKSLENAIEEELKKKAGRRHKLAPSHPAAACAGPRLKLNK